MTINLFRKRLRRTIAPLAIVATVGSVTCLAAPAALAADTLASSDSAALRVRVLQSDMMVAALSCDLRNSYNEAVRRFQAEFVFHGRNLRTGGSAPEACGGARREQEKRAAQQTQMPTHLPHSSTCPRRTRCTSRLMMR